MRIGSTFSGIGGLEMGLEWAGVGRTVWQVEIDPFCRDVLAHHWPDAARYDDVRTVGSHNLEPVDVICGGYPCQPFSIAGKQLGESDPRHLWPELARIIRELRPRFAVLENVPAHLGIGFGSVLADLSNLGYDAEWSVVSACALGAPHPRERVFILAYSRSLGLQGDRCHDDGTPSEYGEAAERSQNREQPQVGLARSEGLVAPWGTPEPPFPCVADGIPNHPHHIRSYGNAVVPAVAEVVGRRLLAIKSALDNAQPSPHIPFTP
jgi:DNA (cytosine-5)-methyltransferase 1